MGRINVLAAAAIVILGVLAGFATPASAQSVVAFEGARLIVGDGRVIENGTLLVDGTKIAQAGAAADVRVPAGATRVNLAGKTVMPMIIDTHVHLSSSRDAPRRTSEGSGSPRTYSIWRTRRDSSVPGSTRSRTAFATGTSTTSSWPCS